MALWHRKHDLLLAPVTLTAAPPVETLYNSDAFPRWTKGAAYTLPLQPHRPACRLDARWPHPVGLADRHPDRRHRPRRFPRADPTGM
jgi:aspartyl-tRNA(Asn)/glutamyl-tRNA(Gln) amidotransferase subunit A